MQVLKIPYLSIHDIILKVFASVIFSIKIQELQFLLAAELSIIFHKSRKFGRNYFVILVYRFVIHICVQISLAQVYDCDTYVKLVLTIPQI